MAFIHTNFLTGNDTTGDGSIALPYKTVFKALGLAASNDTIKVAGGQWVPIAGDFTFTFSSITVDTSVSQVGIINVDDIITFEDGQYGFDKFHCRVTAVTTTTLTLSTGWSGPTQIVAGIYKIDTFNYSTATTNVSFETWNTTAIQPAGRTNITISGGWNSGYTDNSNGWTVARRTGGANGNNALFNATTFLGDWKQNLIFDKFMLSRYGILVASAITATNVASFAVVKLAMAEAPPGAYLFSVNNISAIVGLYQRDIDTPVTFIINGFSSVIPSYANGYNPVYLSSISTETKILIYASMGATTTNGSANGYVSMGVNGLASMPNNNLYPYLQGSPNKVTLHYRGTTYAAYSPASQNQINCVGSIASNAYYAKATIYANAILPTYISVQESNAIQIEDLEIAGPYASQSSFQYSPGGQTLIDLSQEGKLIESFINSTGNLNYPDFPDYAYGNLSRLVCQNLYATQVKDAEGLKTIDPSSAIYFKDPINGDLRIQSAGCYNVVGATNYKVIGIYEKPVAPFSATFRLKRGSVDGEWNKIAIQYGPNVDQIIVQDITLTESYADYIMTVDPTAITDWNLFPFPLYFGIRSKVPNILDPEYAPIFCYVESINIT